MLGRRGRRILLENCFDLHVVVRHGELIVLDAHAAADDLPLLEVVALVGHGGQGNLRTGNSLCGRCGSRSVAVIGHGDGVLRGCRGCVLLKDCFDLHIAVRHGELIVLDSHIAADGLPLLEVVALFGRGGQANLRACHGFVRRCGSRSVSVRFHGDGELGGHRRRVLLEDCLDLHVVVRHEELVVLDGHAAADDLPLLEAVALVGRGGQGDFRACHGFCMRCGSCAVSVRFHGDGKFGRRRRCVLLEDSLDLHVVVRHEELIVLDGHAAADDLPLLEVVALVWRCGQGDLCASRSGGRSCGAGAVAVRFHGDGKLGRRVFGYRNRQLLRIAAHAVSRFNGEFGGAIRSRRAADLAGVLVQAQTGRQIAAVNAPCDRHGAGGNQGLAVRLAHLTVRQSVRGDGNGIDAGLKLCHQLGYICRNAFTGRVQVSVAAKPHKVAAGISVGAGQPIGCRRSKFASVFYNDLDIIRAAAQFAAAKVKGNGFQPIRLQCIRVQNFKDGAETEVRSGVRSIGEIPIANRAVPTHCTALCPIVRNILSPRICRVTVSDISVIFVQYLVPFVALRVAAYRIARASIRTSC